MQNFRRHFDTKNHTADIIIMTSNKRDKIFDEQR